MQNKAIKVSIYGSEYLIRAGEDSAHIEQLAQYVDEKMREVNQDGALKSPLKVAILAALNIADEYYKSREEYSSSMKSLDRKARELIETLDDRVFDETGVSE